MISIQVNGEQHQVQHNWTIGDLLQHLQVNSRYCAVERNQGLVPREQHSQCVLRDGDQIEIVTLVGGG